MRGDIFVARKMYREAIETYQLGPRTARFWPTKTGIAYQPVAGLESAKKNYERAVKLPGISEADQQSGDGNITRASLSGGRSTSIRRRCG